MTAAPTDSQWRVKLGFALVAAGLLVPLTIPLVWATPLSIPAKAALSTFLAVGLPELLLLAALPVLGKRRLQYGLTYAKRRLWNLWRMIRATAGRHLSSP